MSRETGTAVKLPKLGAALVLAAVLGLGIASIPARTPDTPPSDRAGTASSEPGAVLAALGPHVAYGAVAAEEIPYPPQQYLPLVRHSFPEWSGTARFGFGVLRNLVEVYNLSPLGADWYVDFRVRTDPPPQVGLEYVPTIRLYETEPRFAPNQATIENYARAHPSSLYLIGNEPDAPAQDCITPRTYAKRYRQLYQIIKAADPSAKVAIGGVVQATPLRLQYLDTILSEYQRLYGVKIPVDVWNVHGFILQEKKNDWGCQIPCGMTGVTQGKLYTIDQHDNMTIFREQIRRFRTWMKDHGERNKPLIVTEYGILMPSELGFDQARVRTFMLATFDYFLSARSDTLGYPSDGNKLVQAWCWYSLDDDHFEGWTSYSHLINPTTKQLTALGRAYRDYTASLP